MKFQRYIWALPNTTLGLLFVPLALFTRGGMHVVNGVLELHSRLISLILKKCMPVRGGVSAITLGQNRESLSINRRHEHAHVHVRQYEMLGPIFIPVSEKLISWLTENQIKVLNVAGPRLLKDPTIYDAVLRLLKVTLSAA